MAEQGVSYASFTAEAKGVVNYGITHGDFFFDGKDLTDFIVGLKKRHKTRLYAYMDFFLSFSLAFVNPTVSKGDYLNLISAT